MDPGTRSRFLAVLHDRRLFDGVARKPRSIFESCEHAAECWKGIEERKRNPETDHVPLPWVGARYPVGRLVMVGINYNDFSGLDSMVGLVEAARSQIATGRKSVRFEEGTRYRTLYWHRLAAYANAVLGIPNLRIGDAFDHVAITNHVVCSPAMSAEQPDRSNPTDEMWRRCGRHVLRPFLEVLAPRIVLVLGSSTNWGSLLGNVLNSSAAVRTAGWCHAAQLEGDVLALGVPHPSYYRARHVDVLRDLAELMSQGIEDA